jgi:hypothetical protein
LPSCFIGAGTRHLDHLYLLKRKLWGFWSSLSECLATALDVGMLAIPHVNGSLRQPAEPDWAEGHTQRSTGLCLI